MFALASLLVMTAAPSIDAGVPPIASATFKDLDEKAYTLEVGAGLLRLLDDTKTQLAKANVPVVGAEVLALETLSMKPWGSKSAIAMIVVQPPGDAVRPNDEPFPAKWYPPGSKARLVLVDAGARRITPVWTSPGCQSACFFDFESAPASEKNAWTLFVLKQFVQRSETEFVHVQRFVVKSGRLVAAGPFTLWARDAWATNIIGAPPKGP